MKIKGSGSFGQYVQKNWHGFLSVIYPSNCQICGRELPEGLNHICSFCYDELEFTTFENYSEVNPAEELFWGRIPVKHVYSLLYYRKEGQTQELLYTLKYKNGKELAQHCGELIGKRWLSVHTNFSVDALIPIPLHSKKAFKRGYNQSQLLAEGLQKQINAPICPALLRTRHHQSQTKKNRFERQDNVNEIFKVNADILAGKKHVLIIDDVLTTGATLEAAAQAIKNYDPTIIVSLFTLALVK